MSKENGATPKEEVVEALNRMARPWTAIGEVPPAFSVKELSRTIGLSPARVISAVIERGKLVIRSGGVNGAFTVFLEDTRGERVNGNIELAAKASAPSIRAVRESRYQSRAPGGGPVVKARVLDRNLDKTRARLGRERLKVKMEPLQEDPEEKRRREIKEKQAIRILKRYGVSEKAVFEAETNNMDSESIEQDASSALNFLSSIQYSTPVRIDVIAERIRKSRETGMPLTLFVPWGVRPAGEPKLEVAVMDRLQGVQSQLRELRINAEVLIMTADVYATEINNQVNRDSTIKYFGFVETMAQERGFDFVPWSQIRQENLETYRQMARVLTADEIRKVVDLETIQGALRSSARRSGNFTRRGIEQAAFSYMRERIIEGQLIDALFEPIKISVVAKYKDRLDGPLPRIYVVPQEEQFPWLK